MTQENTLSCKKALPKKRNRHLDFLKFLSALMVICVHAPAPEPAGFVIALIGKVSVLIFFMISGYFYSHVKEKHKGYNQRYHPGNNRRYGNTCHSQIQEL